MHRGHTGEQTRQLLDSIRKKVPGIAIRTTMIVGYPGETEENFNELLEFVKESRFERLGVFTYSHEEDTLAFGLEDNVPDEVKQERAAILMDLQQNISMELNQAKVGLTYKVIIDREESEFYVGRSEFDSPEVDNEIIIRLEKPLEIGGFAKVKIIEAEAFDLMAELVE
jgi:ribosomal protein S12 methylthiotransferase